ncbi:hypothetical protein [Pseudomonas sp. FeS53a]|uniref:hypothetical protein n=1 Tax=Pseudomonas sp. FeS53a TaxID=1604022 RepID=UPI0005CA852C|nr:hypothetical protein [Pseudomonas sp. FeS53a]
MDNPFQSPTTDVPTEKGGSTSSPASLALRLAILAFCSVQFLVLLWNRGAIWDAMRAGEISVFGAAGGFLFAFLLMLAGALLFFAQRSARWLLLACLPYQLYALATAAWCTAGGSGSRCDDRASWARARSVRAGR